MLGKYFAVHYLLVQLNMWARTVSFLGDTGHGNRHVPAAGSKLSDYVLSIKVICHTHAGTLDQRHWTKLQK